MVVQHGILLAADLIATHFGPLVAKVCDLLLRRGALPLPDIARRAEVTVSQAKNCLLVLIQHNCVQAFSIPRGAGDKTVTLYIAIFDNIINRMRFNKFLAFVRAEHGPEAETLLEGLLQNGRLTFDQLVERTISKATEGSSSIRDDLRVNFNKLVHAHYVERCPKPEPFLDPSADDQYTSARRRSAKTFEKAPSLEQQVITAAALSDVERYSEIPDTGAEISNTCSTNHQAVSGDKRKYESLEMDQELNAKIAENEVLWRANYEIFIFGLKKKVCAERMRPKLGVETGLIWEAFFEASFKEKVKGGNSATAPMRNILERLREKPGRTSLTLDEITRALEELQCCSSVENGQESFTLDLSNIVEGFQNDEIESLVKARYGQEAFMIFRLLATNGHPFETDYISEKVILEKKVVQENLYKLWKDEYIDTERILSHGTGNTQLFVWKVKKKALHEHVLDVLYQTALNLRQKTDHITEQQHEVPREAVNQLALRKLVLQLSLLKLDDSVMLFHDF